MKRRSLLLVGSIVGAVICCAVITGCGAECPCSQAATARRPNVIPDPRLRNNPRLAEGQRVFMEHCNQCHVGGAAGLGPSLNDKPIPTWFIRFQVRKGLGSMPAYSSDVITDSQLEDVVTYLRYLRQHPEGAGLG
jgi:mono/diheme cytochrome c family protein